MRTYKFKDTGTDHAFAGGACEDSISWSNVCRKVLLAMADGMGSARRASDGSTASTKSAERALRRSVIDARGSMVASVVSTASVRVAMADALNATIALAGSRNDDVGDYNTTLMVVSFDDETGVLDYGYVGDGGIIVAYDDRSLELLEEPQKGADARSTYALTCPSMWRFGRRDSVAAFLVATDGVSDALRGHGGELDEMVAKLLLDPAPSDADLDGLFGATLENPADSPVAGVVDDRSVFVCWSSKLDGCEGKVL